MSAAPAGKPARKTAKKPAAKKKAAGSVAPAPVQVGRPTTFTQEIGDAICEGIASGKSLRAMLRDDETLPASSTIFRWLSLDKVFSEQYARAREAQADAMADEILQIADDGQNDTYVDDEGRPRTDTDVIARSRLRVDARRWLASKLKPKVYGEKVDTTISGPDGGPVQHRVAIEFVVPGVTE